MTENDIKWIKKQTSNRLIDVLADEEKIVELKKDYKYKKSVLPRLQELGKIIYEKATYDIQQESKFIRKLINELNDDPSYRLTSQDMTKCNELWSKYKT